jgi:hypothetical protein
MPTYVHRCPNCKSEIIAIRPRKYEYVRDECNAGTNGRKQVRMKYVRTVKK